MIRLRDIPGAVADLTLGTMIVIEQLTIQAREQARLHAPPSPRRPRPQA